MCIRRSKKKNKKSPGLGHCFECALLLNIFTRPNRLNLVNWEPATKRWWIFLLALGHYFWRRRFGVEEQDSSYRNPRVSPKSRLLLHNRFCVHVSINEPRINVNRGVCRRWRYGLRPRSIRIAVTISAIIAEKKQTKKHYKETNLRNTDREDANLTRMNNLSALAYLVRVWFIMVFA